MNMVEAVKSVLSQYVGFSGRARRSEFWYWILATIIAQFVVGIVEALLGLSSDGSGPISGVLSLAIFLPGLAVTFRRLHDIGRSGWWIGGFYLGAFIFAFVIGFLALGAFTAGGDEASGAAMIGVLVIILVLAALIYSIVLLVFLCTDSHVGPNKYGPNPKSEGNYDVFE